MKAYVLIKTRVAETPEVIRTLRRAKDVRTTEFSFGPYDVIATVEAESLEAIGRTVAETIRCTPGVVDTCTCLVVEV